MQLLSLLSLSTLLFSLTTAFPQPSLYGRALVSNSSNVPSNSTGGIISPKVMLISMFSPEDVWTKPLNLTNKIPFIGASPLFPNISCSTNGEICHVITGEAEINAAATISSLVLSPALNLTSTYFLVGGIAGVNPYLGTTGGAYFARFAVQVAQSYEIDAREIPSNWTTGYFLYDTTEPGMAAKEFYGTEVFELNTNLLARALAVAKTANLTDTTAAATYRAKYDYAPANQPPSVGQCDVTTSDVYFAGTLLAEAFGNITKLFTNGTGNYCTTAQEDNATLESLLRAAKAGLVDFSRIVIMRTASDFDRAPPGVDAVTAFLAEQHGFSIAISNIYNALYPVLNLILSNWTTEFSAGIAPQANFTMTADPFMTLEMGVKKRGLGGEEVVGVTTMKKREWMRRIGGTGKF